MIEAEIGISYLLLITRSKIASGSSVQIDISRQKLTQSKSEDGLDFQTLLSSELHL